MCNGSGKVEKFGTHLARVVYTDSQGRTIYHNVGNHYGLLLWNLSKMS